MWDFMNGILNLIYHQKIKVKEIMKASPDIVGFESAQIYKLSENTFVEENESLKKHSVFQHLRSESLKNLVFFNI